MHLRFGLKRKAQSGAIRSKKINEIFLTFNGHLNQHMLLPMSFPAMLWTAPGFSLSPMEALTLFQANSIFIWTSFALLLYDWVSSINKEVELVWTISSCDKALGRKLSAEGSGQTLKRSWYTPTYITTKITFLTSRK
jgi:hypothetical protein